MKKRAKKMEDVIVARQGDVGIVEYATPPKTIEPITRDGDVIVVAHGEVTGHRHLIREPSATMLRAEGVSDRVIAFGRDAVLEHDEHGPIQMGGGTVRGVRIQSEYSEAELRVVAD